MPAAPLNFELTCEREDGTTVLFGVHVTPDDTAPSKLNVYARPEGAAPEMHEFYYASLERVDGETVQSLVLTNELPAEYRGLGLSAELIIHLASLLGVRIRSSRRATSAAPHLLPSGAVDDRNTLADRVWQSLVARGLAEYSVTDDRYFHPREKPQHNESF
jgi:hypothetical protein